MNQDGLQDLHDAKVLQLILFAYIYAMPFVYFPYKALGQAVLEKWGPDHPRPLVYGQSISVIGGEPASAAFTLGGTMLYVQPFQAVCLIYIVLSC
jgi:hypothetical protein